MRPNIYGRLIERMKLGRREIGEDVRCALGPVGERMCPLVYLTALDPSRSVIRGLLLFAFPNRISPWYFAVFHLNPLHNRLSQHPLSFGLIFLSSLSFFFPSKVELRSRTQSSPTL